MSIDACPSCNSSRTPDGKFCVNCGYLFNDKGSQRVKSNIFRLIVIFIVLVTLSYLFLVDFEGSTKYTWVWVIVSFFVGAWGSSLSNYINDRLSGISNISIFRVLLGLTIPFLLLYLTLFQVTTVENYEATKIYSVTENGSISTLNTQINPDHFYDIRIEIHAYVLGDCDFAPRFSGSIKLRIENEIIAYKSFTSNSCKSGWGVPETGTELAGLDSAFLIEESQLVRNVTVEIQTNEVTGIIKSKLSVYQDPETRPFRMEFFFYYIIWITGGIISLLILAAALGKMRRVQHYADY